MIPLPIAILLFGLVAAWLIGLTIMLLWVFFGGLTSSVRGKRRDWTRYVLDAEEGRWRVKADDDPATAHETPEQALLHLGRSIRDDDS